METVNPAEQHVYDICKKSFLSMWTVPNPQGKDANKELCDILVVCEPDIIIFSVKDITPSTSATEQDACNRWRRKAITESAKQLHGAEHVLQHAKQIVYKDGSVGLPLSEDVDWRYFRIAVAFGGGRKIPFESGYTADKGFVHVFDEKSFETIVRELDTITDFVDYLKAKEALDAAIVIHGGEEDLLAFYLHNDRSFPCEPDLIVVDDNLWASFLTKPEVASKKKADKLSYYWDKLVEERLDHTLDVAELPQPSMSERELAVRVMARETRYSRRCLCKTLLDFIDARTAKRRIVSSISSNAVAYVFTTHVGTTDTQYIVNDLRLSCLVARKLSNRRKIIGLSEVATCYIDIETLTAEDEALIERAQNEGGIFEQPQAVDVANICNDEYPSLKQNVVPKVGRNVQCPCGSGKKYKYCHGAPSRA